MSATRSLRVPPHLPSCSKMWTVSTQGQREDVAEQHRSWQHIKLSDRKLLLNVLQADTVASCTGVLPRGLPVTEGENQPPKGRVNATPAPTIHLQ